MVLRKWEKLPRNMRCQEVRIYYNILDGRRGRLMCKFVFDRVAALIMLIILLPVFLIIAVCIKLDSPGRIFFRQKRITRYGEPFYIYKFRTMVENAESLGGQVTISQDVRITRIGKKIRFCRLDELPQLINILKGEMSFVGTRPEVPKYVQHYTDEMLSTLLLPAGVTSQASIKYKDEEKLLLESGNAEKTYVEKIVPTKMKYNLRDIRTFSFWQDIATMLQTAAAVIK